MKAGPRALRPAPRGPRLRGPGGRPPWWGGEKSAAGAAPRCYSAESSALLPPDSAAPAPPWLYSRGRCGALAPAACDLGVSFFYYPSPLAPFRFYFKCFLLAVRLGGENRCLPNTPRFTHTHTTVADPLRLSLAYHQPADSELQLPTTLVADLILFYILSQFSFATHQTPGLVTKELAVSGRELGRRVGRAGNFVL